MDSLETLAFAGDNQKEQDAHMSTIPYSASAAHFITFGDVMDGVTGIPLRRIRLHPSPGTATEQDLLRIREQEKVICELIDGVLVEKRVAYIESVIAYRIGIAIGNFIEERDLGLLAGEAGMLRLSARLVRAPDVSFVSWEQFPGRRLPQEPILGAYPDLAVEVLSPSNTEAEMTRKIGEYFDAGTRLVWVVDPPTQTAVVYTSPENPRPVPADGILDGGDVLPGFQLELARVFRGLTA